METMRELSHQTDPQSMVREYYTRMKEVNPLIDRRLAMSRRGLEYPQFRITRYSEWEDDIDPWKDPDRLPLLSGGILAELIYANEPRIINDLVVAPDDPAAEYLADQRSLQAIPLMDQGKSLNMSLHTRKVPNGFAYERLPEAVWLANLFGRATNNLVLAGQLKSAYEEIDREMKLVARIQRALLPMRLPKIPRLKLAAYYQTATRAGGDYYDFFQLSDGRWGLFIADVSGHGSPAAVMMAVVHSLSHTYAGPQDRPWRMLGFLNDKLRHHYVNEVATFVTAFYGIFDPATLKLTYCSAGHNPPRLRSSRYQTIQQLILAQTFPLGVQPSIDRIDATIELQPGDHLVLYTDGIVEAVGPDRQLFGTARLDSQLSNPALPPQEIVDSIITAVKEFTHDGVPGDDRTVVVGQIS